MTEQRGPAPKRRRANAAAPAVELDSSRSTDGELTQRGRLTRERVLASARIVFERDGYLDTRVADIADEAGVAHGTFYTYFKSKEQVFLELATGLLGPMMTSPRQMVRDANALVLDQISAANRSYLGAYRASAKLMGIVEQVAMFDPGIRKIRQDRADAFTHRAISNIRQLQRAGTASPDIDATYAAVALTSMVSRFAYVWLADELDVGTELEFEKAVSSLSLLWIQALGISRDARVPTRSRAKD